ncbi:uncharacterized protein N7483_012664 [Penicillium malachiteum]|uniref:uncharacterized protein n=1 Tax=Penicillium malachiteum TaxID=1324776 RepID=UPI0025477A46|nr:uncharacterized protein N7483_012664 [Penicillium malachiteum]KAJ5715483.1 hypothetical protein N7483_012664 [Penicillium malachiteum]
MGAAESRSGFPIDALNYLEPVGRQQQKLPGFVSSGLIPLNQRKVSSSEPLLVSEFVNTIAYPDGYWTLGEKPSHGIPHSDKATLKALQKLFKAYNRKELISGSRFYLARRERDSVAETRCSSRRRFSGWKIGVNRYYLVVDAVEVPDYKMNYH